ncbi:MAG: SRPBCC family protein [Proteobacteria bacterium]|nr:SRPBCC family protein [Pseudomonadota bacterium]
MLKFFAIAVGIAVVLIGGLVVYASTKPGEIRVQRQAFIKAPAERIFPLINDFRAWQSWSPYEAKDPAMKRELSGPASGKGAAYAWVGNKDVGEGRMEILEATAPSRVLIDLTFLKPMTNRGTAEFTLAPGGEGTDVTWTMVMPAPLISKVMSVFFDLDEMIGKDFAAGLANLKARVEAGA